MNKLIQTNPQALVLTLAPELIKSIRAAFVELGEVQRHQATQNTLRHKENQLTMRVQLAMQERHDFRQTCENMFVESQSTEERLRVLDILEVQVKTPLHGQTHDP